MTVKEARDYLVQIVCYEGRIYKLQDIILWYDEVAVLYRYSATLVEMNTNTSIRVPLEKVERMSLDE